MISRRKFIKAGIISTISFVFLDVFWFEKSVIQWNNIDLIQDNITPIKFIHLTDLHFKGLNRKFVNIAKKINDLNPEIIFFTGDSLDSSTHLKDFNEFLKLLRHDIEKFAIPGNWEYWGKVDLDELKKVYLNNNCKFLINENIRIQLKNRTLNIIGIDDYIGGNPDFHSAMHVLKTADKTILLSHCPAFRDVIRSEMNDNFNIDLILSGHTHGGQINLMGFVPFVPDGSGRYLSGFYQDFEPFMYVSKGIGTSILPLRFGARAEIAIFKI